MFTALVAVLAACVLMLGLVNVAMADKGGNGTQSTATTAPGDSSQGGGSNSTATSGPGNSSQGCDGSHNSDTGHGANHSGPYDNTCDGSPSGNGNGNGNATGKPCAGCVGNADDKNPKGQYPNGSDHNAGYECDRNHGIGRTNPAHTGCKSTETPPPTDTCPGGDMNGDQPGCGGGGDNGCPGGDMNGDQPGCGGGDNGCPNGDMNGDQPGCGGNPCPGGDQLGTALEHSAALALVMLSHVNPALTPLSNAAAAQAGEDCGHGGGGDNGCPNGDMNPDKPGCGEGHTPVTVCHREGNGSYHVITFDDDALPAHLAHGDISPVPADGCPASETSPGGGGGDHPCPNGDMNGDKPGCGEGHTPVTV